MTELIVLTIGIGVGYVGRCVYERIFFRDIHERLETLGRLIYERQETHATEIVRVEQQRDKWKQIATRLVSGAEQQIDDLRGTQKPSNDAWLQAWHAYDKAAKRG